MKKLFCKGFKKDQSSGKCINYVPKYGNEQFVSCEDYCKVGGSRKQGTEVIENGEKSMV